MRRRRLLLGVAALGLSGLGARWGFSRLARAAPPDGPLSEAARSLVEAAFAGLDARRVLDVHVHAVGVGAGGTGCFVNPRMSQWARHPVEALRFSVYRRAAGVGTDERADREYVEHLVGLIRSHSHRYRCLLLAFDKAHRADGSEDLEATEFFVPNDYVLTLAREFPDCFLPVASVHPYRKDALEALDRAAAGGAVAVKWLPNAQGIAPGEARCDPFYDRMVAHGLPLLTHAGEEQAIDAEEAQAYGNPLHLRRPLDLGVKVLLAHCASLGQSADLDAPGQPQVESFDLFLRLMGEERYRGRLFGETSALAQSNRCGRPLRELLVRTDLHPRLVNGSDYPLPAINALLRTSKLETLGYLSADERQALNELDRHDPLLFDLVLKRCLKVVADGVEHRFAPSVFEPPAGLFRTLR